MNKRCGMRLRARRIQMAVAVLAVAMVYATSACVPFCQLSQCLEPVQQSPSSDCHSQPQHHSGGQSHHNSQKGNCSAQWSSIVSAIAPSGPELEPNATSQPPTLGVRAVSLGTPIVSAISPLGRDHAPARISAEPLYKMISLLRI